MTTTDCLTQYSPDPLRRPSSTGYDDAWLTQARIPCIYRQSSRSDAAENVRSRPIQRTNPADPSVPRPPLVHHTPRPALKSP
jgi:hypothetical protein